MNGKSQEVKVWLSDLKNVFYQLSFSKVECVFLKVVAPLLPHAGFGRNDHRKYTLHFMKGGHQPTVFGPQYLCRLEFVD